MSIARQSLGSSFMFEWVLLRKLGVNDLSQEEDPYIPKLQNATTIIKFVGRWNLGRSY